MRRIRPTIIALSHNSTVTVRRCRIDEGLGAGHSSQGSHGRDEREPCVDLRASRGAGAAGTGGAEPAGGAGVRGAADAVPEPLPAAVLPEEQRENATVVIRGLLSGLTRKTCEPIARESGVHRKPVQSFVGSGAWDDEAVMAEVRRHVTEELGDGQGVLVIDPSSFVKKGTHSCGVKRQWWGRVGAVQNCQLGVFLCYASAKGHAPLDRRLYLPEEWADDPDRRKTAVRSVKFRLFPRTALGPPGPAGGA